MSFCFWLSIIRNTCFSGCGFFVFLVIMGLLIVSNFIRFKFRGKWFPLLNYVLRMSWLSFGKISLLTCRDPRLQTYMKCLSCCNETFPLTFECVIGLDKNVCIILCILHHMLNSFPACIFHLGRFPDFCVSCIYEGAGVLDLLVFFSFPSSFWLWLKILC